MKFVTLFDFSSKYLVVFFPKVSPNDMYEVKSLGNNHHQTHILRVIFFVICFELFVFFHVFKSFFGISVFCVFCSIFKLLKSRVVFDEKQKKMWNNYLYMDEITSIKANNHTWNCYSIEQWEIRKKSVIQFNWERSYDCFWMCLFLFYSCCLVNVGVFLLLLIGGKKL